MVMEDIRETIEKELIIQSLFPPSNKCVISKGVSEALLQIEYAIGEKYKNTEWFSVGFERNGVVDRISVFDQTVSDVWFSSDVKKKGKVYKDVAEQIKESRRSFGKGYDLRNLFHSHHNLGKSFSPWDEYAFPGFLSHTDVAYISDPLLFVSSDDNDISFDDKVIVTPNEDTRRAILELSINRNALKEFIENDLGISAENIDLDRLFSSITRYEVKERLQVCHGFSVVFDRMGGFLAKQGIYAEPPVSGGDFLHKYRDGEIEFVEVDDDFVLKGRQLDEVLYDKLHIQKPVRRSRKDTKYLDKVYLKGKAGETLELVGKVEPDYNMVAYEFVDQLEGYMRRALWKNESKYSVLVSNTVNRLVKNTAQFFSDGLYLESLCGNADVDPEGDIFENRKLSDFEKSLIRDKVLKTSDENERKFITDFTYAALQEKDHHLEIFIDYVLEKNGVGQ